MEYAFGILAVVVLVGSLVSLWARDAATGFAGLGAMIVALALIFGLLVTPLLAVAQSCLLLTGLAAWRLHRRRAVAQREDSIASVVAIEDPRLRMRAMLWLLVIATVSIPVFRAIFSSAEHFSMFSITDDVGEAKEAEVVSSMLTTMFDERAPVLLLVVIAFFGVILFAAARHVRRAADLRVPAIEVGGE